MQVAGTCEALVADAKTIAIREPFWVNGTPVLSPSPQPLPAHDSGQRTPDLWFDTTAFSLPAAYTFGTTPRNSVIRPGLAPVDMAI